MKTIIFFNNKGGVGKTSTVNTVSHMMAEYFGKRVLNIDLDPQMNCSMMFSEINFTEIFEDICKGRNSGNHIGVEKLLLDKDADIHDCIVKTKYKNLDIIPSCLTLSKTEDIIKSDVASPQQFRLKNKLAQLDDEYDYCIIDTSPSLSLINMNGLAAEDELYIPLKCDGGSLLGVGLVTSIFETVSQYNTELKIGGIFFTQWNGRKNVSKVVYEIMKNKFGKDILPITIGNSKNIEEGSLVQKPLLEYDSGKNKCRVTRDYLELTRYILNRNE